MAAKAVDELTGKTILFRNLPQDLPIANKNKLVHVSVETQWNELFNENQWLQKEVCYLNFHTKNYLTKNFRTFFAQNVVCDMLDIMSLKILSKIILYKKVLINL